MLRSISRQSGESMESVLKNKKEGRIWEGGNGLQKKVLSMKWNSEGVMDDESGELMESTGEVLRRGLGESELDRLVRGWRREAVDSRNEGVLLTCKVAWF